MDQEVVDGKYLYAAHHSEEHGKGVRRTIWNVFWILLIVTACEVVLGLYFRDWNMPWSLVKGLFIVFTIVKSYYIVAIYMHMRDERTSFQATVLLPYIALGLYCIILFINEGSALFLSDTLLSW